MPFRRGNSEPQKLLTLDHALGENGHERHESNYLKSQVPLHLLQ
jgi:hypothetical protein